MMMHTGVWHINTIDCVSMHFPCIADSSFFFFLIIISCFFHTIYSVKKLIGESVCSWSCRNTVAFTAVGNADGEEREMIQTKIHIVDPDRPWELHR